MRVLIVSVIYYEPEWQQTKACIEACAEYTRQHLCEVDITYIDRKGYGSLAKAYNSGYKQGKGHEYDWIWMVSNVTFAPEILMQLLGWFPPATVGAINPVYESDHLHLRNQGHGIRPVPFVEFTAPVVNGALFARLMLDENMPYWGHDLDWSHRARLQGYELMAHDGAELGHSYIRFAKKENRMHPITLRRLMQRRRTDESTRQALLKKYGINWQRDLFFIR